MEQTKRDLGLLRGFDLRLSTPISHFLQHAARTMVTTFNGISVACWPVPHHSGHVDKRAPIFAEQPPVWSVRELGRVHREIDDEFGEYKESNAPKVTNFVLTTHRIVAYHGSASCPVWSMCKWIPLVREDGFETAAATSTLQKRYGVLCRVCGNRQRFSCRDNHILGAARCFESCDEARKSKIIGDAGRVNRDPFYSGSR